MFNKLYNGSSVTIKLFSRTLLLLLLGVLISNFASAQTDQLVISEVTASGEIEIFNGTDGTVELGTYWLCNFPAYDQLEDLTVDCGDLSLQPGATVVVSGWDAFDSDDAEVGLYSSAAFSSSAAIVSYVEYGSTGHQRSAVAVAAGIWETGMFLTAPTAGASIQTQADVDGDLSYVNVTPTPCTPDASLLPAVVVDGGAITLADGTTETSICVDGVADPLEVIRDGNGEGPNREFVITDDIGTILALPGAGMNGPFDLDPAGPGTCGIWYLAYEDGLTGLEVGNNISDLAGNFDFSNEIVVVRQAPDGGMVSLLDGTTFYEGTAGNIIIEVQHTTTATALSYWYIITDDNDDILAFANSAETNILDLSGAPAGECHVWGWSYRGEGDPVPGENISTLMDGDCETISDNFITVSRLVATSGGAITLADGTTETSICVDGVADPLEVIRDGNGMGANREFVITDDIGAILALPGAGMNGPFDLDPAGPGTCEIWYLAYEDGLTGLETGNNLSDLDGNFGLSNPITVVRQSPDGGMVSLLDGSTFYVGVAGDIVIDVQHTTTATALSYWYIITDDNDNILAFANSAETNTLDLSGAPAGECHIWGWSYRGEGDPVPGDNISTLTDGDCETISDNFITVERQVPADGGMITLADGTTETSICVDGVADPLEVIRDGNSVGTNREFVITDDLGNILALPGEGMNGPFDLDPAGPGTCEIWYIAYEDGLEGLETGGNLSDLDGNFGLSNPIIVIRQAADGGTVSLSDGSTVYTGDAGDIVIDVTFETSATALSYWYVITDDNDIILDFANSAETNTLDLSGAPVGECHVWGWSYRGEGDPVPGDNISSLTDGDCEEISANFITVIRNPAGVVNGGALELTDGTTETSICVDGVADPIEVIRDGNSEGANREFVITDDLGNTLALPGAGMNGPFDLDPAGPGTCEIWYLAYEDGLEGLETGNNLSDLVGVFALSNPITVIRQAPDGGEITLANGETTYTGDAGDIVIDVQHTTTATALSYWYIITDDNDNILEFVNSTETSTLDLSAAPVGVCRVWGWSYRGEGDPVPGDNISSLTDGDCETISDNFITVNRLEPSAVNRFGEEIGIELFPNPVGEALNVRIDGLDRNEARFDVYNMQGQRILSQVTNQANGTSNIATANLPSGSYVLRIVSGGQLISRRFNK